MASLALRRPALPRLRFEPVRRAASEALQRPRHAWHTRQQARRLAASVQGSYATVARLQDAMLTLTTGAHRAVLDVRGAAWARLPEASQDLLIDQYAWWLQALGHEVQWTAQVRPDTLAPTAATLEATALDGPARDLAHDVGTWLRGLSARRAINRRRYGLVVPTDRLDAAAAAEHLSGLASDLAKATERIGLVSTRLDDAGLAARLRPSWVLERGDPAVTPEASVPPDWTPAAVAKPRDAWEALWIDHGDGSGHWLRGWALVWPPSHITSAWFAPLLGLDVPLDLAVHLRPLEKDAYQEEVRRRLGQVNTAIEWLAHRGGLLWPGLAEAKAHHEQMDAALNGPARGYEVAVTVVVHARGRPNEAPDEGAMGEYSRAVEREFRGLGGRWHRTTKAHDLAAQSCRPEGVAAVGNWLEVDGGTAALLLPALTATIGADGS